MFKKTILALALSTAAIAPAFSAEGIVGDGSNFNRQQTERVMQNRGPANAGVRTFFLQDGQVAPRAGVSMRQESAPGFGG